jgi:hypothetical protein
LSAGRHSALRDGIDERDNHDLSPTFLAPVAGEKELVLLPDLLIRTGAENSTMEQWHGTAKARQSADAFPIRKDSSGQMDGYITVVLKP